MNTNPQQRTLAVRGKRFRIGTGAIVLLLLILMFAGCPGRDTEENAGKVREFKIPVELGKVVYMDVVDRVRTVGNIQAEQRVVITSEVEGQIVLMPVEEGTRLRAGHLLARIDPREYELQVERLQTELQSAGKELEKARSGLRAEEKEQLEAEVRADESSLNLAKKDLERSRILVEEGVVAQAVLDADYDEVRRAEEELRASRAELAAAMTSRAEDIVQKAAVEEGIRKQLAIAELDLSKTEIRAPFDGVVITKEIEEGAYAGPGTKIIEMIGSSSLKAVLEMPQSYRTKLNRLESVEFFIRELGLRFHDKPPAKRVRVIPDASIYSGNIRVQVDLKDPDPSLFPGLTLESMLSFGVRKNVLHVPATALVISEQGTVVYIVKDERAHRVPVQAFKERNEFVEVKDITRQLSPKEDLILRGSGAVFPGAKVFATNPEPEAKPPFNAASRGSDAGKNKPSSPKT